jgi:hypothetical protein
VDEDAVKWLQFGLLVGSDFDIGGGLRVDGHAGDYSIMKNDSHGTKSVHFWLTD